MSQSFLIFYSSNVTFEKFLFKSNNKKAVKTITIIEKIHNVTLFAIKQETKLIIENIKNKNVDLFFKKDLYIK